MSADELLRDLRGQGFQISVEAGQLVVRPASKLSPEQRAQMKEQRYDLLALLFAQCGDCREYHYPDGYCPVRSRSRPV